MSSHIELLDDIGKQLALEQDTKKLLNIVLEGAMKLTSADGGSVYSLTDHDSLKFEIVRTLSLDIFKKGDAIQFPEIPLHLKTGEDNTRMVVACAVLHDEIINIADAYNAEGFDLSGTRLFDKHTGYHTQSVLTIPMYDHQKQIIGILQLINATDNDTGEIYPFTEKDQHLVSLLTSQAAFTLASKLLFDRQQELLEKLNQVGFK